MKHFIIIIILGSFVIAMAHTAFGGQVLRMGYIEFPPVFHTDASGKPEGSLIDLAEKVTTEAGFELHAESLPAKRMAAMIVKGHLDLWIGAATLPQFKDTTLIGESVLTTIELRAYAIGEKPPIAEKTDLVGKSVLILRGYSYGGWIGFIQDPARNVKYIETDTHLSAFKMLELGRADYLLDYRGPSDEVLKNHPIPELNFTTVSSLEARFVVSRKSREPEKILQRLEEAYQRLAKAGKL